MPAVSLYVEFDAAGVRQRHVSRVEQVWVARNIRHGDWEHRLEQAAASADAAAADLPWEGLPVLYRLACGLRAGREAVRGAQSRWVAPIFRSVWTGMQTTQMPWRMAAEQPHSACGHGARRSTSWSPSS